MSVSGQSILFFFSRIKTPETEKKKNQLNFKYLVGMDRETNQCIDKNVVNVTCDFVKCSNPFKQKQKTFSIPREYLPNGPQKCSVPDECIGLKDDDIRKLVKQKADAKLQCWF